LNLGIDLGGTFVKFYSPEEKGKVPTPKERDKLIELVAGLVKEFRPERVGIAVAGLTLYPEGKVVESPNLPFLNGLNLREEVKRLTKVEPLVVNDATAAAYGEYEAGAGEGESSFLCLTLGTGLGGGAVIEGKTLLGSRGLAMEAGHLTVCLNGWPCHCGRKGCLEAYASSYGLERHYFLVTGKKRSSFEVVELAKRGQEEAKRAVKQMAFYLSVGITGLAHLFNPEKVVLSGGIVAHYPELLKLVEEGVKERAFKATAEKLKVVGAQLGEYSGAVGAYLLALLQ